MIDSHSGIATVVAVQNMRISTGNHAVDLQGHKELMRLLKTVVLIVSNRRTSRVQEEWSLELRQWSMCQTSSTGDKQQ